MNLITESSRAPLDLSIDARVRARRRVSQFAAILMIWLGAVQQADAQSLTTGGGNLYDFFSDGSITEGTSDSYDGCYYLVVDGVRYAGGASTTTGRTISFPVAGMSGLDVSREAYVPSSGGEYARMLDLLVNTTGAPITVSVGHSCNLGSDTATIVTGTSSGDNVFSPIDDWITTNDSSGGDPSLAHVLHGPGARTAIEAARLIGDGLEWTFAAVTVPAGGRVGFLTFAVQQRPDDDAIVRAEATRLSSLPSDAVLGIESVVPDVVNFGFTPACVGSGTSCTTASGTMGTCHFGACCTGCWDGAACHPAGTTDACGIRGGSCTSCLDASSCTLDTCIASTGTCFRVSASVGTSCDDGLFCTATDACNGSGACVGSGTPCDDTNACTADACAEASDSCTHPAVADGTSCTAATPGVCHVGVCCRGCWDGTACQMGTTGTACGTAGGACRSCSDGDACTSDFCSAGSCANPPAPSGTACDDGLYCTTMDRCDGADRCMGMGSACDDGTTCTVDVCIEATHACDHTAVTSACIIGGVCHAADVVNPANPCQICDPARDMASWSARIGTICGSPSCASGTLSLAPTCDATGACGAATSVSCPTGVCADPTSCAMGCSSDAECTASTYCDTSTHACMARRAPGQPCGATGQCATGVCSTSGVCCDRACDDVCSSCSLLGFEGTCSAYAAGTDPEGECPDTCSGGPSCGGADAGSLADAAPSDRDGGTDRDAAMEGDADTDADVDGGLRTDATAGGCCGVAGAGRPGAGALLVMAVMVATLGRRGRRR